MAERLGDLISTVNGIAGALGTEGKGEIDRGNGKMVNWSYKGMLMGFEYKYMGICVDRATGTTSTVTKQSRTGAIEHAMRELFQQLAAKNAL